MRERKLVIVVEHGRSPIHQYIGEVEHNDSDRPIVVSGGPQPGMVRIFSPLQIVNDEWGLVVTDPRRGPQLVCQPAAFLPHSSVEMRAWIEIPAHSFASVDEAMARCYLAGLESARIAMEARSKRVVAEMEAETEKEAERARAAEAGLVVVTEKDGKSAAASIADIQSRIKGGSKAS